jgi:dual specificity phosphatase 12
LQDVSVRGSLGVSEANFLRTFASRTELANREHMLDHGQLGPPTPAVAFSPVSSRRPSSHDLSPRRPSSSSSRQLFGGSVSTTLPHPRRSSASGPTRPSPFTSMDGSNGLAGLAASMSMSALDDDESKNIGQEGELSMGSAPQSQRRRGNSFGDDLRSRLLAGLSVGIPSNLSMSALDNDDDESVGPTTAPPATASTPRAGGIPPADTVSSPLAVSGTSETMSEDTGSAPIAGESRPLPVSTGVSTLQHGADLAAQLSANPKLAALRSPGSLTMTPLQPAPRVIDKASISPPILMNPKCSGYFVEPVG